MKNQNFCFDRKILYFDKIFFNEVVVISKAKLLFKRPEILAKSSRFQERKRDFQIDISKMKGVVRVYTDRRTDKRTQLTRLSSPC